MAAWTKSACRLCAAQNRKPCRLPPAMLFLGLPLMLSRLAKKKSPTGFVTRWGFFICTAQPPAARRPRQQARNSQKQTPPPADRQKPPPEQTARQTAQAGTETSQKRRQSGTQATRHGQSRTHDTQQQTQASTPKGLVMNGRGPGTGRDTRHVFPRWPGHRQARPPLVGGFAALRGACLGLAGRLTGRHSRPQAAFSAPRRARMRGEAALAPPVRAAILIAAPAGARSRATGASRERACRPQGGERLSGG